MLDIGTLLVVVSLSQPLAARLRLSPLGLCAMIGMAIDGASRVHLMHSRFSDHGRVRPAFR
jgi:hypothetical protein